MAFGGAANVKSLGKLMVRITGITLAHSSSGTISLNGGGGDVQLPASFPSAPDSGLLMSDIVEVRPQRGNQAGTEATHVHVDKQETPFLITISNDTNQDTGSLEI